jgi:hypothetical protein
MRLRPRRRNLVVWSSSAAQAGGRRGARPARRSRIRWWLRLGALFTIIGVLRFGRTMRARWEPLSLMAGILLLVAGYLTPAIGMFFPGLLVLTVTLLKGNSDRWRGTRAGRPHGGRAGQPSLHASYWAAAYSNSSYRPARCSEGHTPR